MTLTIRPAPTRPPRVVAARLAVLTLALSVFYGGGVAVQKHHLPAAVTWSAYLLLLAVA